MRNVLMSFVVAVIFGAASLTVADEKKTGELTRAQVLKLVGVLDDGQFCELIGKQGTDFLADEAFVEEMKKGGATPAEIEAVKGFHPINGREVWDFGGFDRCWTIVKKEYDKENDLVRFHLKVKKGKELDTVIDKITIFGHFYDKIGKEIAYIDREWSNGAKGIDIAEFKLSNLDDDLKRSDRKRTDVVEVKIAQ